MILAVRTKHLGGRRPHIAAPRLEISFFLDNDRGLDPRPKLRFLLDLNPNLVEDVLSSRGGWRSDPLSPRGGVGVGGGTKPWDRALPSHRKPFKSSEDIPTPHSGPPPHRGEEEEIPDLRRVTVLSTGLIQILAIPASTGEPCPANQVSKSRPGARDLLLIPKKSLALARWCARAYIIAAMPCQEGSGDQLQVIGESSLSGGIRLGPSGHP